MEPVVLQSIITTLGSIVVAIITVVVKSHLDSRKAIVAKEREEVIKESDLEEMVLVQEWLEDFRDRHGFDRVSIFQFHNGGSFADGTSIKRFSVTHESCENGVPSVLLDSQDVLLTRYMELVGVMDNRPSKIIKTSELSPSAFRSALEINNVEYFSVSPLRCLGGITPLGFVCCHWCTSDSLDEIEKEGISQSSLEQLISESVYTINTHLAHKTGKQ